MNNFKIWSLLLFCAIIPCLFSVLFSQYICFQATPPNPSWNWTNIYSLPCSKKVAIWMVSYVSTVWKMWHWIIYVYKDYNIYHVVNCLIQSKWKEHIISTGYSLPTCVYYSLMQDCRWNTEPTVNTKVKGNIFLLAM